VSATEAKAWIFDIQSFSLKDGPGIRTAVFFKGCPLRCQWCHNPESHVSKPQLMYRANLCVGCMRCVDACRHGAQQKILVGSSFVHVLDREKCVDCGECVESCCYGALEMAGQEYTPSALLEEIRKDLRYFSLGGGDGRSGDGQDGEGKGGLTFSGGEPMLYPDFIAQFCALAPEIHTAVETSGQADREAFEKVLDSIDLFLFDFKLGDSAEHEAWCGAGNSLIVSNLDFLHERGKEIVLRLPLIPGVNDTESHAKAAAEILKSHPGIRRAEILPYHTYGLGKLDELGRPADPALPGRAMDTEQAEAWAERLKALAGPAVRIARL